MSRKMEKIGIAMLIMVVLGGVIWIIVEATGAANNPETKAWLNAPVSEMRIWHLLFAIWFISAITSSSCNCKCKK